MHGTMGLKNYLHSFHTNVAQIVVLLVIATCMSLSLFRRYGEACCFKFIVTEFGSHLFLSGSQKNRRMQLIRI